MYHKSDMVKVLDFNNLKNMLLGGASELKKNIAIVNELNVFPVPDGDTGTNMLKTVEGGIKVVYDLNGGGASQLLSAFYSGAMLGARGNSGVIFSEFIKGFAKEAKGEVLTVEDIKNCLNGGVKCAYNAVDNPVEGTILTVIKQATEYVCSCVSDEADIVELLIEHLKSAQKTLIQTKEMLPQLKEADVVDSGGAGYVYILQGMLSALTGEEVAFTLDDVDNSTQKVDLSAFTSDSVLTYGYCTELLVRLQNSKVDVNNFDEKTIISYLKSIGGDSIVASKTGDLLKVHVHTFEPGNVLLKLRQYGEFLTVKIENMSLQHNGLNSNKPRKKTAIVSVVSGEGLKETFSSLGADVIVDGGQTQNPSTEDFIRAFDNANADNIIVLPNNSNVILTAKQAGKAYDKSKVFVVETKSIQHGYVAVSIINTASDDILFELDSVSSILSEVVTIDVTYAVRNACINGKTVKKGDFMAISSKEILASSTDKLTAALNALSRVKDIEDKELLTVFFGADVTPQEKYGFEEEISKAYPDLEYCPYDGGQDVYSFLICIE